MLQKNRFVSSAGIGISGWKDNAMKSSELIHKSIMQDMTEGVMTIGMDGVITYVNPAAASILEMEVSALTGKKFIQCFFEYSENDAFNQTILDAVYDSETTHRNVVPYFTGSCFRQLHVTTSYLHDNGEKVGVIAVLSDISELTELRDAVKAMQRIQQLNSQLELRNKLLSETFGRFLSDEIVRQLLDTPDGLMLGGKKRTLTIMMSDLRGFTAMSERMEPQSLIAMLNHYLGVMTDMIQQYNGTIIEFIGDGILAIFGAPLASDHHAADAVAAAVAMQMQMKAINEWNAARGFPNLEMGIGINTGEVIVGNIGSEKRTKYGVVGSHVNLCGRIESYTTGGQILISPETRAMIRSELDVAQELEVYPKGVKGALTISYVTGIGKPYGLSCAADSEQEKMVPVKIPVRFKRISDKHCSDTQFEGIITAINSQKAILQTQIPLKIFENISLCADNDVFCKVIGEEKSDLLLCFTAGQTDFCTHAMKLGVKNMADHKNERRFSIAPDQEALSEVSDFLDSCVEEFAIPMRMGFSLKIVADEIFSNIVYYSGSKNAEILFRNDTDKVTLVFMDDGIPYNPMEAEEPDITADVEERKIGGLGLFMVKKMAEQVQYEYADQKNQLTVVLSKTVKKMKLDLEDF